MSDNIYSKYNIDINCLKRNYITNPIKKFKRLSHGGIVYEKPEKEDLEYLYNICNVLQKDLPLFFNVSLSVCNNWLKEYNIKKIIPLRIKNTYSSNQAKYGISNIFELEAVKNKIKLTNKEKYGVVHINQKHIDKNYLNAIKNKKAFLKFIENNNIKSVNEIAQKCNISNAAINRLMRKLNIPYFPSNKSFPEQEIRNYISNSQIVKCNVKNILPKREIDIYIPSLNIGIEFNGNYWHSERNKTQSYHQEKSKLAEDKGIFLYHIFEYEWFNKKTQILTQLNNLLDINNEKIYAKHSDIKAISNNSKNKFLQENHILGKDLSLIKLGLFYNNELIGVMTFSKFKMNNYKWKLSRYCSKYGYNIIDGAITLLNYFITIYKPNSIIAYSDIAKDKNEFFENLGFKLYNITTPKYIWVNGYKIISSYQYNKLKSSQKLKYYKLYDCGRKIWIRNL